MTMSVVLTFVEHEAGTPTETSLEMLTLARDLGNQTGSSVVAATFGPEGGAVADELADYGVSEVHYATGDAFDVYAPEAWAGAIGHLVEEFDPEAVVAPGSDRGHEVLSHVAADTGLPMSANCMEVDADGDGYQITRQRWGGSLTEHARLDADTKLLTAAAHEFPIEGAAETTDPSVQAFAPSLDEKRTRVRIDRVEEADIEGVPLGEARVVIGGGRGVGDPDGYDKLERLADLLGGTVGASRAAVNEGWRPHDDQVGLTGTKISPDIYIACGISGAVQHMVGCKGAKNILAINTDPEAAIIGKAEYAVIADLHELVPELNEEIEQVQD